MTINIEPVSCFNGPAVKLEGVNAQVELGVGLKVVVVLKNAANEPVSANLLASLTPEQYEAWTGDDAYVLQSVATNLGLYPL